MANGSTFQRYEYKYRMSRGQYDRLRVVMEDTMILDQFGKDSINNIYFDSPDFLLIRRSLEKPVYKEKLRVRWYGERKEQTPIFIELKKKYKGIVYKRRIKRNWTETRDYFLNHIPFSMEDSHDQEQIAHELDYFMDFYENLSPAVFLGYEREAYYGVENPDFRMTFDGNICCTRQNIYHQKNLIGDHVIGDDEILMEVKTGEGLPQWLLTFCAKENIHRSSFSKYGTAYTNLILPDILDHQENHQENHQEKEVRFIAG